MSLAFDPHIASALDAGAGPRGASGFATWRPGDVSGLRRILNEGLEQMSGLPRPEAVVSTDHSMRVATGQTIALRWYEKTGAPDGSAVVFFHGGARVAGGLDLYDPVVRMLVDWAGVPFLSVDYRLAPEAGGATAVRDGFQALDWLLERRHELGVDADRVAVMGDSAGGGVAAGVAVLARDGGIDLAKQILVYPMLDDRNVVPDPHLADAAAMFSYAFNETAWSAVLNGVDELSAEHLLAAPARTENLRGLAPAYIEVGEMDIFRDEDVRYASRLWHAGVPADLHVHSGYSHAFDLLLLGSPDADRLRNERIRVLQSF